MCFAVCHCVEIFQAVDYNIRRIDKWDLNMFSTRLSQAGNVSANFSSTFGMNTTNFTLLQFSFIQRVVWGSRNCSSVEFRLQIALIYWIWCIFIGFSCFLSNQTSKHNQIFPMAWYLFTCWLSFSIWHW